MASPAWSRRWPWIASNIAFRSSKRHRKSPDYCAAIRDGIENLKGFVTAEGVFNMSDRDHNGVDATCQVLVRVENGRWKFVAP